MQDGDNSCPSTIMFSFDYPPDEGGISRMCCEIAVRLSGSPGFDVLTVDFSEDASSANAVPPGIVETRVIENRPHRELSAWWHMLRRRRDRSVVIGTWYPEGLIALLAGHRRLVILAHGAELTEPEQRWRRPVWARVRRWVLESANAVVANSNYTAGFVRQVAPKANVVALPLAVDHQRFSPGDKTKARRMFGITDGETRVVCTVSRIHGFKGLDVVLRAIAAMPAHQRERLVYLVGGLGPARADLQALAAELDIEDNVRWLGFVPEADLPELYRAADLFALCTREQLASRNVEGFGLVYLEAQSCGTPAVGTRTGGIPDAIHEGEGGWLIDQDDVAALSGILAELVEYPERFAEQGRRGRARVEREATWDHYMRAFTDVFAEGRHG